MHWHDWLMMTSEVYICVILTLEYLWGRSDTDIKKEAKRRKQAKEKYGFENLTDGESK